MSCQATEPDLSSVAALIPVLQTTDMRDAFNFPLKCPGTTEGRGVCAAVCLCLCMWEARLNRVTAAGVCLCMQVRGLFLLSSTDSRVRVCQEAVTSVHIIPDDIGCRSRARPTININGQEQVDWELSYQGGPS